MKSAKIISIENFGNLPSQQKTKAKKFLHGKILQNWIEYIKRIKNAAFGDLVIRGFTVTSIDIIEKFGFDPIKIFYSTLTSITIKKGQRTAYLFCETTK